MLYFLTAFIYFLPHVLACACLPVLESITTIELSCPSCHRRMEWAYYDGTTSPNNYPKTASWYVFFAQNLHTTASGSSFTQITATPIIHYGGVCENGVGCTGNRDLYDDFGVAVTPSTGFASIVYSDDQYTNDARDPPGQNVRLQRPIRGVVIIPPSLLKPQVRAYNEVCKGHYG